MIYRSRQAPAALRYFQGGRQLWPERLRLSWWKAWGAKKRLRSLVPSKSDKRPMRPIKQFPCQSLYSLQNRSKWLALRECSLLLFFAHDLDRLKSVTGSQIETARLCLPRSRKNYSCNLLSIDKIYLGRVDVRQVRPQATVRVPQLRIMLTLLLTKCRQVIYFRKNGLKSSSL